MLHLVSRETHERLELYASLAVAWNRTLKLASASVLADIRDEVADSCELLVDVGASARTALDIGSGNGLPAIPMSIAGPLRYDLVESDQRKAAFLREVARRTLAPVTVVRTRIEAFEAQRYDVITSRAFAPLDRLLDHAALRCHEGTVCIFPKGAGADAELRLASVKWRFNAQVRRARRGVTVVIRHLSSRNAGTWDA